MNLAQKAQKTIFAPNPGKKVPPLRKRSESSPNEKITFSPQALKTFIFVYALVPISHECEKYLLYSSFDTWPEGVSTLLDQPLNE